MQNRLLWSFGEEQFIDFCKAKAINKEKFILFLLLFVTWKSTLKMHAQCYVLPSIFLGQKLTFCSLHV